MASSQLIGSNVILAPIEESYWQLVLLPCQHSLPPHHIRKLNCACTACSDLHYCPSVLLLFSSGYLEMNYFKDYLGIFQVAKLSRGYIIATAMFYFSTLEMFLPYLEHYGSPINSTEYYKWHTTHTNGSLEHLLARWQIYELLMCHETWEGHAGQEAHVLSLCWRPVD